MSSNIETDLGGGLYVTRIPGVDGVILSLDDGEHETEALRVCDASAQSLGVYLAKEYSITPEPQFGKWTPVSERLPGDHTDVLVDASGNAAVVYYINKKWNFVDVYGGTICLDVDVWMPLPEPYKP